MFARKKNKRKDKKGVFKMVPLDQSFENLLLRKIPGLTREELEKYDHTLVLSQHLRLLASVVPPGERKKIIEEKLDHSLRQSYGLLKPYWKQYARVHKIWLARRKFAQNRGSFSQIVSSWDRGKKLVTSYWGYQLVNLINNTVLFFIGPVKQVNEKRN
jgi:hypothetical protein